MRHHHIASRTITINSVPVRTCPLPPHCWHSCASSYNTPDAPNHNATDHDAIEHNAPGHRAMHWPPYCQHHAVLHCWHSCASSYITPDASDACVAPILQFSGPPHSQQLPDALDQDALKSNHIANIYLVHLIRMQCISNPIANSYLVHLIKMQCISNLIANSYLMLLPDHIAVLRLPHSQRHTVRGQLRASSSYQDQSTASPTQHTRTTTPYSFPPCPTTCWAPTQQHSCACPPCCKPAHCACLWAALFFCCTASATQCAVSGARAAATRTHHHSTE